MIKIISHQKEEQEILSLINLSIPIGYETIKEKDNIIRIKNNNSPATIRLEKEKIIISGANIIVKNCFQSLEDYLNGKTKQNPNKKRSFPQNNKCGQPICTCGLCDGFFNK